MTADFISTLAPACAITALGEWDSVVALHREVRLEQPASAVVSARLVATAHGIYEAAVNGRPVTQTVFNPGWTSYEWRLQVQDFDISPLIAERMDVAVVLAGGWWRGHLGFEEANVDYGPETAFLGVIEIRYADGAFQRVVTDETWVARTCETTTASIYGGQVIDARRRGVLGEELPLHVSDIDRSTLVAQTGPHTVRHETVPPVKVWTSPGGRTLVDFGQNLVGWLRLRARGEAGTEVIVRHAEVLEEGELGVRPLREAKATDRFILSGGADEFEPTMTFHGFRYAEVEGYPGALAPESLEAVVVHSDVARTGWFECSDPRVNRLVANSVWSQRGNFLDIPTDCPQRDERLGWTGDIAVYAPTAAYQFDVADFLHKWMLDLEHETRAAGADGVPNVVPALKFSHIPEEFESMKDFMGPTAVWGDAAVWVPWALWTAYGDREHLAAHYPSMVLHLESVLPRLSPSGLWDTGFQFGDHLDPDASPDVPLDAKADRGVVATASLYRSATIAAEAAAILSRTGDGTRWQKLADRTRAAFNEHYVDDGRVLSDCATVYALAICFGLLDPEDRSAAGARLAELGAERDYRVSTGFAGTPFVTRALSETGHVKHAYRLLLEDQCPSWLYPVSMGATTIWERWDSMLPDGSINPGKMTSFNHYALGAIADWIYQAIGGIRPAEPGYSRLTLAPTPGPGLDWARGALDTRHGRVECGWRREGNQCTIEALVPDGVVADLHLPDGRRQELAAGRHIIRIDAAASAEQAADDLERE